ncbi:hypothetical protein [Desertivibrio insolitus]|uniref:hypothetical protein n=1 Tax=Herbiconiux sp. SYSU D00978 TaxID=2812562 RepID=UPI001A95C42F|nr:hypothetical protein [Herbiconiux sp. SYSU D00978]
MTGEERQGGPARTADGRYVVIDGRRWRASDPEIPEDVAAELRRGLMAARRAVGAALRRQDVEGEREARRQVQRYKVALGERGVPWWEQSDEERRRRWSEPFE